MSVRAWRTRLHISQEKLAERAGLHRTYVCDIERGSRNVSLENIEKLARALEISVAKLFSYEPSSGAPDAESASREEMVEILFVEDDPNDVEMAKEALRGISNRVQVARDGREALDYLFREGVYANRSLNKHPQLILLDLGLPKINGLDVLRRIKSDPRTSSIPVIVLTASNRDRDLQISKRLGVHAYIVKPVGLPNLAQVTPQFSFRWALLRGGSAVSA
jgi:CheY-like chemotaxis protein/DNA-binding Xre family transcriptional regulator